MCFCHCAFSIDANIKTLNVRDPYVAFVAQMTFAKVYTNAEVAKH